MTATNAPLSGPALEAMRAARRSWPTAMFASAFDPRFCYALHVPTAVAKGAPPAALLVAVHGSGRDATSMRDALVPFADAQECVVLTPLFPIGVRGDGYADGYKYLLEGEIRYDLVLLAMVDEVAALLGVAFRRFLLFGFSGGGHFAHRMFYLHPDRLSAVSIGAPGSVTLIDDRHDWWRGTRNVADLFGAGLDLAAMRRVPVELIVGAEDTREFVYDRNARNYVEGMEELGRNRVERNTRLLRNFEEHGLNVRQDIVAGVAHEGLRVIPTLESFLLNVLARAV